MSFFRFKDEDIINTSIVAHPSHAVELNGDQVTGSIYLEKQSLNSDIVNRKAFGFSEKKGGFTTGSHPYSASIDVLDAELGADNKQLYESVLNLYSYYSLIDSDYTSNFTGSTTTRFRVMVVPEIYYDRQILTGSLTASDFDSAGDARVLYDNGRGGIYSGSITDTLVGNIFYSEGLVVLKGGGLNDEGASNDFGENTSGMTWTGRSAGAGSLVYRAIAHDGSSLWCVVGDGSNIYTSTDGVTWTKRTADDPGLNFYSVAHDGSGLWVAAGSVGRLQTSSDGITWASSTVADAYASIIYGLAHDGSGLWCFVGQNTGLQTSSDAITWTSQTPGGGFGGHFYACDHNQSNLWVIVGSGGEIQTSPDGITWTARTADDSYVSPFRSIAYNGSDLWCIVGDGGEIQTSPDGITWTSRTSTVSSNLLGVDYDGSRQWMATGDSGVILTSPDGISWTDRSQYMGAAGTLTDIAHDSNSLWAVSVGSGDASEGDEVYTSSGRYADYKWKAEFKGQHTVPVKIFRCRAPAGQLNASSNSTFFTVPSGSTNNYRHERKIVLEKPFTYITTIGLFNKNYELVGLAKLAQPVKKTEEQDILFRIRLDV